MISRPIVRIGMAGVALGFAVMIVAIAIVVGFKKEIREKVIGFGSDIQISNYDKNNSYESTPLSKAQVDVKRIQSINGVTHVEEFATKAGIIKAANDIEGVVVKGVANDFDWSYFKKQLIAGNVFDKASIDSTKKDGVVISKIIADKLQLKAGDKVIIYLFRSTIVRVRLLFQVFIKRDLKSWMISLCLSTFHTSGSLMAGRTLKPAVMK